ncbi:MAG TPA: hypothetical protein PLA00_10890, partial [Syntrophorhabdaceae bacterium]|nr:hypothetical protein [Syntrophorhabdaceae bacterium]
MRSLRSLLFICVLFLSLTIISSPAYAQKEIKIGVLYPLSGALATIGRDLQRAAELTADIINNKTPGVDIPMAKW